MTKYTTNKASCFILQQKMISATVQVSVGANDEIPEETLADVIKMFDSNINGNTLVAADDHRRDALLDADKLNIINIVEVPSTDYNLLAKYVYDLLISITSAINDTELLICDPVTMQTSVYRFDGSRSSVHPHSPNGLQQITMTPEQIQQLVQQEISKAQRASVPQPQPQRGVPAPLNNPKTTGWGL